MFSKKSDGTIGSVGLLLVGLVFVSLSYGYLNPVKAQEFSSSKFIQESCSACEVDIARAADLDSDGDMDILVGSTFPYIGWFENIGSGFSDFKMISRDPGYSPVYEDQGIVATDISGDGSLDLLSGLMWYKNSGSGTFSEKKRVSTGLRRFNIPSKTADITGDGREDIVAFLNNELVYFENDNFGNSANAIEVAELSSDGYIHPIIRIGDLDDDGDADIVASYGRGGFNNGKFYLAWYENQGNGDFSSENMITSRKYLGFNTLRMTDLDSDGDKDLLTTASLQTEDKQKGLLGWFKNTDGEGAFSQLKIIDEKELSKAPVYILPIDFDSDGDQDIVSHLVEDGSNAVQSLVRYDNQGGGTFKNPVEIIEEPSFSGPFDKADINADGLPDILYPVKGKGQVRWLPNLENGILGEQRIVGRELSAWWPGKMYSADMSQNGKRDVILHAGRSLSLKRFENTGMGFADADSVELPVSTNELLYEDINGDDIPDMIYSYDNGKTGRERKHTVKWAVNNGSGEFSHRFIVDGIETFPKIRTSDVDGDSHKELLVVTRYNVKIFPNEEGSITSNPVQIEKESNEKDVKVTDINGDGDEDLVLHYPTESPPTIVWYENNSSEWDFSGGMDGYSDKKTIKEFNNAPYEGIPWKISAADVDSDGDIDIINHSSRHATTKWLENKDGKGSFSDPIDTGISPISRMVEHGNNRVADVDADGDPDILTFDGAYNNHTYEENAWRDVDYGDRKIWWHENQGGEFAAKKALLEGADRPKSIRIFDINKDGAEDIVYRSEDYQKIEWYENTGIKVGSQSMTAGETATFGETSARVELSDQSEGTDKIIVSKAKKRPVGSEGINAEYTAGIRMVMRSGDHLTIGDDSKIFFDLNKLTGIKDPGSVSIFKRDTVDQGAFRELETTYDESSNELSTAIDTTGEFVFANKFPPEAVADTFSVTEDHTLTQGAPGVLENDKNPQNVNLDISLVSDVTNGELTLNADGSFKYIPEAEFDSTDSFTYQISDGFSTSKAMVTINVETQDIGIPVGGSTEWQLVSFPFSGTIRELFAPNEDNWLLYQFSSSYSEPYSVEPGKGYWLKSKDSSQMKVQEEPKDTVEVDLIGGQWHLIGGINEPVAISDVIDENDAIMETTLFRFNEVYQVADTIRAGKGYWLRAKESGTIKIVKGLSDESTSNRLAKLNGKGSGSRQGGDHTGITDQFNELTISTSDSENIKLYLGGQLPKGVERSAYRLPPKPPEGSFDARFKDGYRLTEAQEPRLELQGAQSLVTMRLETSSGVEQSSYNINIIRDDEVVASPVLSENDPVTINRKNIDYVTMTKGPSAGNAAQQEVPEEFHLEQNYPNPFNPSTTIEFGLPKPMDVTISVYNVIGQRVATLADEFRKAGWHTVKFHANGIASGVYFYRLKTSEWTKTRKFLLLK